LEEERSHVKGLVRNHPECADVIKKVLTNGNIKRDSDDINDFTMNLLVDANILAVIERKFMFHSRIVERACEQLYGKK
jgi:hypothetical protein